MGVGGGGLKEAERTPAWDDGIEIYTCQRKSGRSLIVSAVEIWLLVGYRMGYKSFGDVCFVCRVLGGMCLGFPVEMERKKVAFTWGLL